MMPKVWRTLDESTPGWGKERCLFKLYVNRVFVMPMATNLIEGFPINPRVPAMRMQAQFARVSGAELGYQGDQEILVQSAEFKKRLADYGLKFCLPEFVPPLRALYNDAEPGEELYVLHEPLPVSVRNWDKGPDVAWFEMRMAIFRFYQGFEGSYADNVRILTASPVDRYSDCLYSHAKFVCEIA